MSFYIYFLLNFLCFSLQRKCSMKLIDDEVVEEVRVDIQQSCMRRLTTCIRFPENYPKGKLLLEFKTLCGTLSSLFLDKFINLCEAKLNAVIGKPQIMWTLKFISEYLTANPLCIVLDKTQQIKQLLCNFGELWSKQRSCSIDLIIRADQYYYRAKFKIPADYPTERVVWNDCECKLPQALMLFINGHSQKIARRCLDPLLAQININVNFEPKRSLHRCLAFTITTVRNILQEKCSVCGQRCLPDNPSENITTFTDERTTIRCQWENLSRARK